MKKLNVLSLCDGMSCGKIALDKLGIDVENYFASEIKQMAIKVSKYNHRDKVTHIGDLTKISYKNGVLYTEVGNFNVGNIDLVMFGSPCQTFSIAMKTDKRIGLDDLKKSGLFYECFRILQEVKPKYFFVENVASMKEEYVKIFNDLLGVTAININSKMCSPSLRNRLYWTNIPQLGQIKKVDIKLQDILTDGYTDRLKSRSLLVSDSRPLTNPNKMLHRYFNTGFTTLVFKDEQHYKDCLNYVKSISQEDLKNSSSDIADGVRYLYQEELEKCQCVPSGYTKCLTRNEAADVLGDGWTVDVIAHIFSFLKQDMENNCNEK